MEPDTLGFLLPVPDVLNHSQDPTDGLSPVAHRGVAGAPGPGVGAMFLGVS
jgi:hypothetical protein